MENGSNVGSSPVCLVLPVFNFEDLGQSVSLCVHYILYSVMNFMCSNDNYLFHDVANMMSPIFCL